MAELYTESRQFCPHVITEDGEMISRCEGEINKSWHDIPGQVVAESFSVSVTGCDGGPSVSRTDNIVECLSSSVPSIKTSQSSHSNLQCLSPTFQSVRDSSHLTSSSGQFQFHFVGDKKCGAVHSSILSCVLAC